MGGTVLFEIRFFLDFGVYISSFLLVSIKAGFGEDRTLCLEILFVTNFPLGKILTVFKEQIPSLNGNLNVFKP